MQSSEEKFNPLQGVGQGLNNLAKIRKGHVSLSSSKQTTHCLNLTKRGILGPTSCFLYYQKYPYSLSLLSHTHLMHRHHRHTNIITHSHSLSLSLSLSVSVSNQRKPCLLCKIELSNLRIWVSVFIARSSLFYHIWH